MLRFGRAFLAMCLVLGPAQAWSRPLTPAEQREKPFSAVLPMCDDQRVLTDIATSFHNRETEYWGSGLDISGYSRISEIGYRANGLDYIPRRYCVAQAIMNDNKVRTLSYRIGDSLGIIGWGYGLEWCVAGLDRNYADAPGCKMAQP